MGVDKSYGSGKSRTAANSSARRRVAAGQLTKGKGSLAAKAKVHSLKTTGKLPPGKFDEFSFDSGLALPIGKLIKAAQSFRAAGNIGKAAALEARVAAKFSGKLPATTSSGAYAPYGQAAREGLRRASSSVYPRLDPFSGNTQSALIGEVKQTIRSIQKGDMARGTKFIKKGR